MGFPWPILSNLGVSSQGGTGGAEALEPTGFHGRFSRWVQHGFLCPSMEWRNYVIVVLISIIIHWIWRFPWIQTGFAGTWLILAVPISRYFYEGLEVPRLVQYTRIFEWLNQEWRLKSNLGLALSFGKYLILKESKAGREREREGNRERRRWRKWRGWIR